MPSDPRSAAHRLLCECCQDDTATPRLCADGEVANICDECFAEIERGEWLIAPGAPE